MANILILNGSPRKNGATASLIKAFSEGAKEAGNEIREAYIQGMDVKNCLGWEDLGHILGSGKETEARALGTSIQ